jgi:putative radical SAM enzyme (TIGR03279 family)
MTRPHPARVESVRPDSPAARAGVRAGEKVVRVNGRAPRDYIDYRYLIADADVTMVVEDPRGQRRRLEMRKPVDEDLGLRFTEDVFDGVITCSNRCVFCFVSQLPRGLRPALYVRDDDYRLSFLHGNFITLTNLSPADLRRIARLHLSPLYVSVHALDPGVRRALFGNSTRDVVAVMRRLAAQGIQFHTQIVLCPGINDGRHLDHTVRELAALAPAVRSVGIVPVGLTRRRSRWAALRPVSAELSRQIIASVRRWQIEFRREIGTRLVFAADELYLLSGIPLPGRAQYEDFPQLGNGIGCARLFLDSARRIRPLALDRLLSVMLVTGEMALPLVRQLGRRLEAGGSVKATVHAVANRLFGRLVTSAGLLSGADIANSLRSRDVGDLVIVPADAVREGEGFLDGMTVRELSERLAVPVAPAATPAEASAAIRRHARARGRR